MIFTYMCGIMTRQHHHHTTHHNAANSPNDNNNNNNANNTNDTANTSVFGTRRRGLQFDIIHTLPLHFHHIDTTPTTPTTHCLHQHFERHGLAFVLVQPQHDVLPELLLLTIIIIIIMVPSLLYPIT